MTLQIKARLNNAILYFFVVLAYIIRVTGLETQSLWSDEGYTADLARQSVTTILARISSLDIHPPFYYLLLHFWSMVAGESEWALRYLSLLPSVLSIALLYALGRRLFGTLVGVLAALLGILIPFAVVYAQEVRMYAWAMFSSLASVYFMVRLLSETKRPLVIAYILSSALALYTHYYSGLVIAAQNAVVLFLFLSRAIKADFVKRWTLMMGSLVLLYLPWLPVLVVVGGWWRNAWIPKPTIAEMLAQTWRGFNTGLVTDWPEGLAAILVPMLTFGIGGVAWIRRPNRSAIGIILAIAYVLIPIALAIVMAQQRAVFHPKHVIVALPGYVLVLAFLLSCITKWNRLLGASVLIIVLAAFSMGLNRYLFDQSTWKTDIRAAARFVQSNFQAGDVIAVDDPSTFGYYYHGAAPVYALPLEYPLVEEQTAARLNEITAAHQRQHLYLFQWAREERDPRGFVSFLLDKHATKVSETGFHGGAITVYQLPDTPVFSIGENARTYNADFSGQVRLAQAAWGQTNSEENVLWVALRWELLRSIASSYKSFVLVRSDSGHVVGQVDNLLLDNLHFTSDRWSTGETAWDDFIVPLSPGTPPGEYTIEVGLYDPLDLRRLEIHSNHPSRENGLVLGTWQVSAPRQPVSPQAVSPGNARTESWGELQLRGFDLDVREYTPGEPLPLKLYWHAAEAVSSDYKIVFRLGDIAFPARPPVAGLPTNSWRRGETFFSWYDLVIPPEIEQGNMPLVLQLLDRGKVVREAQLAQVAVVGRTHTFKPPIIQHPTAALLGDRIRFLGYDLEPSGVAHAGGSFQVTLYWQALGPTDKSYSVFAHILDAQNRVRGQRDSVPHQGAAPTTGWLPQEIIVDTYAIPIEDTVAPGTYQLEIGMYDSATGNRLTITQENLIQDRILLDQRVTIE